MRQDTRDRLSGAVIEAAIAVHREIGPGLLESVYQACLEHELGARSLSFVRELDIPVRYRGAWLDARFRLDLLVENELIVELKSVDRLHPLHTAQVLTYLRMSGKRRALLMNFNAPRLIDGIRRISL